jgi:hypothetical protein
MTIAGPVRTAAVANIANRAASAANASEADVQIMIMRISSILPALHMTSSFTRYGGSHFAPIKPTIHGNSASQAVTINVKRCGKRRTIDL